jgi:purine-binding chemotaxis protein CheW
MGVGVTRVGLSLLLCDAGSRVCGLPLEHVIETMRPLPLEPIPGLPPFMTGLSVIRGAPVPVVELGILLGDERRKAGARFILIRAGERRVALCVNGVLGIRALEAASVAALPPLLLDANAAFVGMIGALDSRLLMILETARLVPAAAWDALQLRSGRA